MVLFNERVSDRCLAQLIITYKNWAKEKHGPANVVDIVFSPKQSLRFRMYEFE